MFHFFLFRSSFKWFEKIDSQMSMWKKRREKKTTKRNNNERKKRRDNSETFYVHRLERFWWFMWTQTKEIQHENRSFVLSCVYVNLIVFLFPTNNFFHIEIRFCGLSMITNFYLKRNTLSHVYKKGKSKNQTFLNTFNSSFITNKQTKKLNSVNEQKQQ